MHENDTRAVRDFPNARFAFDPLGRKPETEAEKARLDRIGEGAKLLLEVS